MSNLYKSTHILGKEKIILTTKPIHSLLQVDSEKEPSAEEQKEQVDELQFLETKKKEYAEELRALEEEIAQLQQTLEAEQASTKENIALWWQEKEEELAILTQERQKQAEQQGFEEGYQQALQQVQAEYEQRLSQAEDLIQLAYQEKQKIIQEAEPFLLSLSVKIAQKIIGQELQQHPEQLMHMVRIGMEHVREKGEITIQVASEKYAFLLDHQEELRQYLHPEAEIKIIPDRTRVSGCMIHTASGSYDVSIDSQLSEIKKSLLAFYEEGVHQ